ncbi:hypothetical protein GCM10028784_26920 [Myceligenerans cantabricum]
MTGATERARASTPKDWTWNVEPPAGWLAVPATGQDPQDVVERWEREAVALVADTIKPQEVVDDEYRDLAVPDDFRAELERTAAESVRNLREFADAVAPDGDRVLAAVGVLGCTPIPVLVAVGLSSLDDNGDGLMAALGATGGAPLAPPEIDHLDLPDGDGLRVTRLDLGGGSGTAWVSMALGRRAQHDDVLADTVLVWRSQDLFVTGLMTELLDELMSAVKIVRSRS